MSATPAKHMNLGRYSSVSPFARTESQQTVDLRTTWIDLITARNAYLNSPLTTRALQRRDNRATQTLALLQSDTDHHLCGIDLTSCSDPLLCRIVWDIEECAYCLATPQSAHYASEDLFHALICAIDRLLRHAYGPEHPEYGNWWTWEIGIARALADMMCILLESAEQLRDIHCDKHNDTTDQVNTELHDVINRSAQAINFYVPDPCEQFDGIRTPRQPSTGANRVDLCQALTISAIATNNLDAAINAFMAVLPVLAPVCHGDGFYEDGSFIQHHAIAYTGSYGDVLLSGVCRLFALMHKYIEPCHIERLGSIITDSYMPIIVNGRVLDCVRGRSIGRKTDPATTRAHSIMGSMIRCAAFLPDERDSWATYIRFQLHGATNSDFFYDDLATVAILAPYVEESFSYRGDELGPHIVENYKSHSSHYVNRSRAYQAMDRLIHHADGWSMALSLCSPQIAWYEYGNKENGWGSRTSLGMRYLITAVDPHPYDPPFWPTLDYSAPPGTTTDSTPLRMNVGRPWGDETPSGGNTTISSNGTISQVSADLYAPDSSLHVRRFWLATPESIIETLSICDPGRGGVRTTLDDRIVNDPNHALIVDGHVFTPHEPGLVTDPGWAHIQGTGGIIFLTPCTIRAHVRQRHGSFTDINQFFDIHEDDQQLHAWWAGLWIEHEHHAHAAWRILPGATPEHTRCVAQGIIEANSESINCPPLTLSSLTHTRHAVNYSGINYETQWDDQ
ncbi:polysaccharide lyase family 8 super-sandwich domain-containing protein [Actinomyces vulturis]|uniref:polysaccharide lyase family 8 super-sandwich domain-containing protein n=1 Tax=Actinomyces vulturis TaxID=1857645 RepID=UPI000835A999|nr:polysaccharide lyase family 8 super-sandwich domain-containing protein [Actinomyces vulturis]